MILYNIRTIAADAGLHHRTNVTESAKIGLICTKYTYSSYHTYLFFYVGYTISVSFIEFLRKFCVYNEIFDKILLGKRVIKFERLKSRSNFTCR